MKRIIVLEDARADRLSVRVCFRMDAKHPRPNETAFSDYAEASDEDLKALRAGSIVEVAETINACSPATVVEKRETLNNADPLYGLLDGQVARDKEGDLRFHEDGRPVLHVDVAMPLGDFLVPVYVEKDVEVKTYLAWSDEELHKALEARWAALQEEQAKPAQTASWDGGKWS